MSEKITLRDLQIGDWFIHASAKDRRKAHVFSVAGKPEFNGAAGTATRKCHNITTQTAYLDKKCSLEVIKINQHSKPQTI